MKTKFIGAVLLVIIVLAVACLIFTLLFFPIVLAIVKSSWWYLLWYCAVIPALAIFGYLQQNQNVEVGMPKYQNPPAPPTHIDEPNHN